jgi:hypothetical protein
MPLLVQSFQSVFSAFGHSDHIVHLVLKLPGGLLFKVSRDLGGRTLGREIPPAGFAKESAQDSHALSMRRSTEDG